MLVREANEMSNEMNKQTLFNVTLQISPLNLKLNRNVSLIIIIIDFSQKIFDLQKETLLFEPAIFVKRNDKNLQQIWSLEKFENRIDDMRKMYREVQNLLKNVSLLFACAYA